MTTKIASIIAALLGAFALVSCSYTTTETTADVEEAPENALAFTDEALLAEADLLEEEPAEPVSETCVSRVDESVSFETMPGVSCDEIIHAANHVLVPFGYAPDTRGVFSEVVRICQNLDTEIVYWPQSPQVPALADVVVGTMCPGDRALIVEAEHSLRSTIEPLPESP